MSEFCIENCEYKGKSKPTNKPTPTCIIKQKYTDSTNPVAKSVYREIIANRLERIADGYPDETSTCQSLRNDRIKNR